MPKIRAIPNPRLRAGTGWLFRQCDMERRIKSNWLTIARSHNVHVLPLVLSSSRADVEEMEGMFSDTRHLSTATEAPQAGYLCIVFDESHPPVLGCSFPVRSADFWLCLRKFCGQADRGRLAGQRREFKFHRKSAAGIIILLAR